MPATKVMGIIESTQRLQTQDEDEEDMETDETTTPRKPSTCSNMKPHSGPSPEVPTQQVAVRVCGEDCKWDRNKKKYVRQKSRISEDNSAESFFKSLQDENKRTEYPEVHIRFAHVNYVKGPWKGLLFLIVLLKYSGCHLHCHFRPRKSLEAFKIDQILLLYFLWRYFL